MRSTCAAWSGATVPAVVRAKNRCVYCGQRVIWSPSAQALVHAETLSRNCPFGGRQAALDRDD